MNKDYFLKQLIDIIGVFELVSRSSQHKDLSGIEPQVLSNIISRGKAAVARIVGVNSEYYKDIERAINTETGRYAHLHQKALSVIGTVYALKDDLTRDYLQSLHDIVQSDVFSDYLDMAEHLNSQGYKDAAAVIAGSTLEAHLKKVAQSASIDIIVNDKPKKVSLINDELTKAGVYSTAYQKQVTAWLSIRNDAAHGNYEKYTSEQVALLVQGIRLFSQSDYFR